MRNLRRYRKVFKGLNRHLTLMFDVVDLDDNSVVAKDLTLWSARAKVNHLNKGSKY